MSDTFVFVVSVHEVVGWGQVDRVFKSQESAICMIGRVWPNAHRKNHPNDDSFALFEDGEKTIMVHERMLEK